MLQCIGYEQSQATRAYQQYGQNKQCGSVVHHLTPKATSLTYTPDAIERTLDIAQQRNQCPKQQDHADADKYALSGISEIRIYYLHSMVHDLGLPGQHLVQLVLQKCLNAKAASYGKSIANAGTMANNVRYVIAHACDCKLVSIKDLTERLSVLTTLTPKVSRVSLHTPPEQYCHCLLSKALAVPIPSAKRLFSLCRFVSFVSFMRLYRSEQ